MEIHITLIIGMICCIWLYFWSKTCKTDYADLQLLSILIAGILFVLINITAAKLSIASRQVQYINKIYNTEYTTSDMFYCGDLIKYTHMPGLQNKVNE